MEMLSDFGEKVRSRLSAEGFVVVVQPAIGGLRPDLMVRGPQGRLAVVLDGLVSALHAVFAAMPFDVRNWNTIPYSAGQTARLREPLARRLQSVLNRRGSSA